MSLLNFLSLGHSLCLWHTRIGSPQRSLPGLDGVRVLTEPMAHGTGLPGSYAPGETRQAGKALCPASLKGPGHGVSPSCTERLAAAHPQSSPFPRSQETQQAASEIPQLCNQTDV